MRNPDQSDGEIFWLSRQCKWCPRSSETSAVGKRNSKRGLRLPFICMLNLTCLLILMGIETRLVNSVMCLMDFSFRPPCGVTETNHLDVKNKITFCCMNEAVLHLFSLGRPAMWSAWWNNLIVFSASVFWTLCWWHILRLSAGSGDAVAGCCGRIDSAALPWILQRSECRLFPPPPWRRGDAVTPQVWSPSPETTRPLGRSGWGRPVLSQPLHASTLRGGICLLCSRAGDLSMTTGMDSLTMCVWISPAETYSISHNVWPSSAS